MSINSDAIIYIAIGSEINDLIQVLSDSSNNVTTQEIIVKLKNLKYDIIYRALTSNLSDEEAVK